MVKKILINRTQAEICVGLLEDHYKKGVDMMAGEGADLASELRELFGMDEQPPMRYGESKASQLKGN